MRMEVIAQEATFVISAGLQNKYEREVMIAPDVFTEVLVRSVMPSLLPILTAWIWSEASIMSISDFEAPFTDVYPIIEENLRKQLTEAPFLR
ncbi:hypothetical protein B2J88_35755 [Rhodococcus sp. SRB_17]|nr:hypothetical protein [Rhodococcus sp. SRB_17]